MAASIIRSSGSLTVSRCSRSPCADSARMRENLRFLLDRVGPERVVVRVPLIPRYNTAADQARSAALLRGMGAERLDLFGYVIREQA